MGEDKSSVLNINFRVPILLHCSAGVGRTGTVIAIDRVMQQLKKNSLDSNFTVLDLVKDLRKFRPKMCQVISLNIAQYNDVNAIFRLRSSIDLFTNLSKNYLVSDMTQMKMCFQ